MSEQQAKRLAAMLTEKQKRDLVLLVHILTGQREAADG